MKQHQIQRAADLAAYLVAVRLPKHEGQSALDAIGLSIAQQSGYDGSMERSLSETSYVGARVGDTKFVQVVLT